MPACVAPTTSPPSSPRTRTAATTARHAVERRGRRSMSLSGSHGSCTGCLRFTYVIGIRQGQLQPSSPRAVLSVATPLRGLRSRKEGAGFPAPSESSFLVPSLVPAHNPVAMPGISTVDPRSTAPTHECASPRRTRTSWLGRKFRRLRGICSKPTWRCCRQHTGAESARHSHDRPEHSR